MGFRVESCAAVSEHDFGGRRGGSGCGVGTGPSGRRGRRRRINHSASRANLVNNSKTGSHCFHTRSEFRRGLRHQFGRDDRHASAAGRAKDHLSQSDDRKLVRSQEKLQRFVTAAVAFCCATDTAVFDERILERERIRARRRRTPWTG